MLKNLNLDETEELVKVTLTIKPDDEYLDL